MESNNSDGALSGADHEKVLTLGGGGADGGEGTSKSVKKDGDGLEKTKQVAKTGAKKVTEGVTFGFQLVKQKFKKKTQKRVGGGGGGEKTNKFGKKVGDGFEKTKGVAKSGAKKVGDGLGKTKEVAIKGGKKVKDGATFGFQWLKEKCSKTTPKH
ncbi:uncharacterized protein LOC113353682 [Papaver somniferum]|uniref:uncharacterized protein LOC113353682 n=1 Tax=Papaver somniferum TaxID=3469 RepID=UPI000E6FA43B|nr:uncharacterized protein LOC113353682 [Papaver somniferum]